MEEKSGSQRVKRCAPRADKRLFGGSGGGGAHTLSVELIVHCSRLRCSVHLCCGQVLEASDGDVTQALVGENSVGVPARRRVRFAEAGCGR